MFLYIVWPPVLSFNNSVLTLNPGLALTAFRTILPCFQQVNQTRARDLMENQHLVSGQLQKKR